MSKNLGKFLTPVFRVAFPKVFELDTYGGGAGKYTLDAIWEPAKFSANDKKLWQELLKGMDTACLDTFKKKRLELPSTHRLGIRDGEEKTAEGYGAGKVFAKLASNKPFGVVDIERRAISPAEGNAHELYAGCYARAFVRPYTFNDQGKGVRLVILSLQKVGDGPQLGGGSNAAAEFEGIDFDSEALSKYDTVDELDDEIAF